jgi:hypothetical protein
VTWTRFSRFSIQTSWFEPTAVPCLRARRESFRGARAVAEQALTFSRLAHSARAALVNGAAGIVSWLPNGQPFSVMGFTVRRGSASANST